LFLKSNCGEEMGSVAEKLRAVIVELKEAL